MELQHSRLGLSNIRQILKEHNEGHETREDGTLETFKAAGSGKASRIPYEEAMEWMKIVLDYWTHLRHFSIPSDPRRTVFVTAKHDKYVPREWAEDVRTIWPGKMVYYKTNILKHTLIKEYSFVLMDLFIYSLAIVKV